MLACDILYNGVFWKDNIFRLKKQKHSDLKYNEIWWLSFEDSDLSILGTWPIHGNMNHNHIDNTYLIDDKTLSTHAMHPLISQPLQTYLSHTTIT